jgi:hypothetical protein
MRENRVKRILREGGLALGTHTGGIADPQIVETSALRALMPRLSIWSIRASTCTTCSGWW